MDDFVLVTVGEIWNWLVHQFNITFIVNNRYKLFLEGFGNTLVIAIGASVVGIIIGASVAMVRVYHAQTGNLKTANFLFGVYLAVFRGTPIVVQLLIMYYIVLKNVNNALLVAVLAFGINSGAYVAEIVRAGILSVDIGQTEAGRSLGLPALKTLTLIVLPQAIKNILPALGNEFITLLKETSVAGYVAIRDLARAGANVRSQTAEPYFSLLFIALVYFILVFCVTKLLKILERRLAKSDRSHSS
ncbi:MAG: amino acid ABC transporter permease [Oscillospiraceae bacterium]|nr:amino acid ABC transporter permease [Oscillospiraceae bacterium]